METAFLQAIIEQPDDTALRLIFADYLDEHGHADQAEFIRLQCSHGVEDDASPRETELLDRNWPQWTQPIRRILPCMRREDIHFWLGFPFRITFRRADDMEHLIDILKFAPIRQVDLDFEGNERVLRDCKRFTDQFFVDSDEYIPIVRRVWIRSEQEQRRLDKIFEALLHGMEI